MQGPRHPLLAPRLLGRALAAAALHGLATATLLHAGAHPWLAAGLGSAAGLAANYGLQRRYILRHREPAGQALSRYIADTSVLWALHLFCFGLLTSVAGAAAAPALVASSALAAGLGLCFAAAPVRYAAL